MDWGSSLESMPVYKPDNGELGFVGGEGEEEEVGDKEEEDQEKEWMWRRVRKQGA